MKICQLCAVDFTLYHFLLPLMIAMREEGHEIVGVCAEGPWVPRVREQGIRVETIPLSRGIGPLDNLRALRKIAALYRRERFDIVHVHTPVASLVGRLAAIGAGVPRMVYTAHGFYFHDRMPWPRRAVFLALEWLGGRATDTLFTQSSEDAQAARRYRLCRRGDIVAIGNGSDPAVFRPPEDTRQRSRIRESLGTPRERPVVLTVGRLVAEKGFPELIAAMRDVEAELWVAGGRLVSDHAPRIDAVIESIRADGELRDRVRLLGYRDDIPELMRAADIFTLPSHREGMPRTIIEAMLTGLPVVATDIRGSREEVVHGETGLLVPVGDARALGRALQQLATDPGRRAELGRAGLRRARALYDEKAIIAGQLAHLGLATATEPESLPTEAVFRTSFGS
ncbi:MAG: glycosyltransferase family 4 protein [Alphaproteobacteria bacterium]